MSTPTGLQHSEIILCIPGCWEDRQELVQSVAERSGGYLLLGELFGHSETNTTFKVAVEGRDSQMSQAFRAAGRHWLVDDDIQQIEAHTKVVYIIARGGSFALAKAAMNAADGLLRAGGLAVKVETSGVAHSAAAWRDFVQAGDEASIFRAFVVTVMGDDSYSCGMHSLGFRDAVVSGRRSEHADGLLGHFCLYLCTESPILQSGHTFALGPDEPVYTLQEEACRLFEEGSPFHNPFGIWRLSRQRPTGFRAILAKLTGGLG